MFLRSYYLKKLDALWIGVECNRKDNVEESDVNNQGIWGWMNDEEWSGYTQFVGDEKRDSCDIDVVYTGYLFNEDGKWIVGKDQNIIYLAMPQLFQRFSLLLTKWKKRPSGYTRIPSTTQPTETTVDFDQSTTVASPEVQLSTTVPQTTSSFTMETTTSSIMTSTTTEMLTPSQPSDQSPTGLSPWAIILICGGVLLIVAAIIFLLVIVRKRFLNLQAKIVEIERKESRYNNNKLTETINNAVSALRYQDWPSRSDEWEIKRKFVSIDYASLLGEGAFGSVFLGRLISRNMPVANMSTVRRDNDVVAVKMLHVNILACVTRTQPMLLVSKYCSNGNLLEYLRQRKQDNDESKYVSPKKLIMFANQIVYGLEYLATNGFIHRDIAARNVMVDQQETCKVGDFRLCREMGKEDDIKPTQGGKFPLKWMPPEAIDRFIFSTASDVWPFGVLLFEIVTFGDNPYEDWPNTELLARLICGERMERPENCSDKLFEIMSDCWADTPSQRPSFTELKRQLGDVLENYHQNYNCLQLNASTNGHTIECKDNVSRLS